MNRLTFADGIIKLNSIALDGILRSLTVGGEVIFSDEASDGLSGTKKKPRGWSDAAISVHLELLTDNQSTCYEKLTKINNVFKSRDNAPKIYEVANRHLSARGVRNIVFSGLDSSETSDDDVIAVTASFTEYEPAVVKQEMGQSSGDIPSPSGKTEPKPETAIMIDVR